MGVPKFYRWISERYPCLSEVVKEFNIPDFDNLYLDMNGIIHPCSHPNDDDPHFRISEDKIFANICHYVEFLFKMIKPKKVFFMAVDGVAPRAKMNQQRGRRFRTAKAAITLEEKALTLGEALPAEDRFDSNCITPGTEFMAKLHSVLIGFVVFKLSTDKLWKDVRVYLSGHNVPGEGEHKIMEFIRLEKSKPGYNPNTRHCLYGLDADLIMLGLCSHEPFFSLLREEVKFGGRKTQKRIMTPEETTFHLLHISLLRDYLSHEFSPVKEKISFVFDPENMIDDFVLMSFLVGNDFIPHLPQLHIHHDALPVLFKTYMDVLPSMNGYINEQGSLNLERFEMFLKKLAEYDFQKFEELNEDFQYLHSKSRMKEEKIHASDFLSDLGFSSLAVSTMAEFDTSSDTDDDQFSNDDPMQLEFLMHKNDYYLNKLGLDCVTAEVLQEQAEGYVRAIQWNLHYYYNGVVSWSWYYPHHYSPYISDIKNFKAMEMKFELGKPFLPFQQLLAVLPKDSKKLLPISYQKLMCDDDSPLIDFYPDNFSTDLNGKQQEWEAIVLIPFIDEKLLLKFSGIADEDLSDEERNRNCHGAHILYTYIPKSSGPQQSFLPGYYPDLPHAHVKSESIDPHFFRLPPNLIKKGLCEGVALNKVVLGFPTLKILEHSAELKNEKVKVFQMMSQKENMMLTITRTEPQNLEVISKEIMGKTILVGWPHLREALVIGLSNGNHKIICDINKSVEGRTVFCVKEMTADERDIWEKQAKSIKELNYERWGVFLGTVHVLVQIKSLVGIRLVWSKDGKLKEEKQWDDRPCNFALQTTVSKINAMCLSPSTFENVFEYFSPNSVVFIVVPPYYGNIGTVLKVDIEKRIISVKVDLPVEPDLSSIVKNQEKFRTEIYKHGYIAAQQLGIDSYYLSRLTGTFFIQTSSKGCSSPNKVNIGLSLKFSRKNEEVQGFTRKKDNTWLYSEKTIKLLDSYLRQFPGFFEKLFKFMNLDVIYLEDLYPSEEGHSILNKITEWLKSQALDSVDRQICGLERLDKGIVAEIEQKVLSTSHEIVHCITKNFLPDELHNPYLCKGITKSVMGHSFKLFDRVVNINYTSCVPLGLRGTVIGIGPEENIFDRMHEIVFDKSFSGGMSLSCSSEKGYRLPSHSLLNLSNQAKKVLPRPSLNPQQSIFDSAVKQLKKDNLSPPQCKTPSVNVITQCKPFYAVGEVFQSYTLNSPQKTSIFPSPLSKSLEKQFVTPKADYLTGKQPIHKEMPDARTTYQQNFWAGLKNTPVESPIIKANSSTECIYGQKLSVEELFHSARTQKQMSAAPVTKNNFIELLLHLCLNHFNAPPTYTYHNYGQTNYYIASVSLPNGLKVTSAPCEQKQEAALNAAGKAIANFKTANQPIEIPSLYPVPLFLPPSSGFAASIHDAPLLRHPSPTYHPATHMPDSFVVSNQVFPSNSSHPPRLPLVSNQSVDSQLFHMPGGGTARIKNAKSNKLSAKKWIIPTQVMKQAAQFPFDSSGTSNSEWPDLPPKYGMDDSISPKADNGQVNCCEVGKNQGLSNLSAKKKPKRRIAANFQNS